ncbi:MAG: MerR family transcriptional regulator [Candidatus Cybelea sp.]
MQTRMSELRQVKGFAAEAGVSVRTLHLYDRLGLLKPAAVTESGYRLYGEAELERLEHILALRFVGFSLEQIRELLGESQPLDLALRMQRQVIVRQKRRLESALDAIAQAQRALADDETADRWKILRTVMEVFRMQDDWAWTKEYYSQPAQAAIDERRRSMSPQEIEQSQRDWSGLIARVEDAAAHGIDPNGEAARALAAHWQSLIGQFTMGNPDISRGLNRLWTDRTHWPSDFKRPWSDAADAFIKLAINGCNGSGAVDGD